MTQLAGRIGCALLCLAALMGSGAALSAPDPGPTWSALTPAQQQSLAPLQHDWQLVDPLQKQKWLEVVTRMPKMPASERQRIQARMVEWARLTPEQRAQARLQFSDVRQLSPSERQAKWNAYQALRPDQRQTLARRAVPASKVQVAGEAASRPAGAPHRPAPPSRDSHPVSPIVLQAAPGATTTTLSTRPSHAPGRPAGPPKLVASPGLVDPYTLLPRRAPAASAVKAADATPPGAQP
jgi:hypothetical protein